MTGLAESSDPDLQRIAVALEFFSTFDDAIEETLKGKAVTIGSMNTYNFYLRDGLTDE